MIESQPSNSLQANVLALNRMYIAVHVLSVRRAFCLLWKGVAEVVHIEDGTYLAYDFESWRANSELKIELNDRRVGDDWVCAVNFEIQVPRVIRLVGYDKIPLNVVKFSRRNVFLRDENRCQYCKKKFSSQKLSIDHVLPRSRGGLSTWENTVCACLRCNVRKGGRTPQEAGMHLCQHPVRPKRNPILVSRIRLPEYESWKNFLD